MTVRCTIITPARAEEARLLYDAGAPLKEIEALLAISRSGFYEFRRNEGWPVRKRGGHPVRKERAVEESDADAGATPNGNAPAERPAIIITPLSPDELIPKIEAAIAREFAHAEHALAHGEPRNAEKNAKVMASLVRSLAELKRVKRDAQGHGTPNDGADEPPARDLDELKAEHARRLERLRGDREAG
jgi:hypothetical protein